MQQVDNEYNPSNNLWKGNATGHTQEAQVYIGLIVEVEK
jgi:hypothetical protein